VIQPEAHLQRSGEEHWAGRLYMRRLSPYVTRALLSAGLSANAVTALMLPVGLLAALALTFEGLLPAAAAVVLVQFQLLLDCCDGEVARWRKTFSPKGLYLDQLSHYTTEAALAAALGVRADGGWGSLGGWTALGLLVAVLILILKAETHLVGLARARSGKPFRAAPGGKPAAGKSRLPLREGVRLLPFLRPFHAVEASLLALAAAVVDSLAGDLVGTRVLVVALAIAAGIAVIGHLIAVLASDRLAGDQQDVDND
jgi:phosphatidylglycerophosphate synthase